MRHTFAKIKEEKKKIGIFVNKGYLSPSYMIIFADYGTFRILFDRSHLHITMAYVEEAETWNDVRDLHELLEMPKLIAISNNRPKSWSPMCVLTAGNLMSSKRRFAVFMIEMSISNSSPNAHHNL